MYCKYCSRLSIYLEIRVGKAIVAVTLLCPDVLPTNDDLSETVELAAKTP